MRLVSFESMDWRADPVIDMIIQDSDPKRFYLMRPLSKVETRRRCLTHR